VSVPAPEPWSCGDPLSYQGKDYNTLEIGSQCWMAKNLDYDNGCSGEEGYVIGTDTGWCGYYNEDGNSCEPDGCPDEGLLYQWSAAMNGATTEGAQGVCPDGWHIPKDSEWTFLENNVCGHTDHEGSALAGSADLWTTDLLEGDNDFDCSGLKVLPAGYRSYSNGIYYNRSNNAALWSSTEDDTDAWRRYLRYDLTGVYRSDYNKANAYSVRCLRD